MCPVCGTKYVVVETLDGNRCICPQCFYGEQQQIPLSRLTMKLLDLFCGAGGASTGYHNAGFQVVGVDINPQPHYPFEFHQADALEFCAQHGAEFDVIHASPPCQCYSITKALANPGHPDLIPPVRAALIATGRPFVIENVPGAPLAAAITLCGTMFGLGVIRHRLFEMSFTVDALLPPCAHQGYATGNRLRRNGNTATPTHANTGAAYITVAGNNYCADEGRAAMGIDWMTKRELSQAIPPAYTEWIGRYILEYVL